MPVDDPRVDPPEQKPTKQLPREDILQAQLKQLLDRTAEGFAKVDGLAGDVRNLTANVELVSSDLGVVKDRVTILESRRNDDDARTSKLSGGVRGLSTSNAEQDAQLAQERMAREALAKEVADLKGSQALQLTILTRLDNITKNPLVKTLGAMLLTALVTWLATHGVKVPQ